MSLESAVISAIAKVVPFAHSRQQEHGSWAGTWFLPYSVDHEHLHCFGRQCLAQTSVWSQYRSRASTQPSAIARATDTFIALGSSETRGHKHGFRWQHRPRTSTRLWMATGATESTGLQQGHGPGHCPHPDISMVSSCSGTTKPDTALSGRSTQLLDAVTLSF